MDIKYIYFPFYYMYCKYVTYCYKNLKLFILEIECIVSWDTVFPTVFLNDCTVDYEDYLGIP